MILTLTGYLLCAVFGGLRMLVMPPFAIAGFAGCLHLIGWWMSDRSAWRGHGGPKLLAIELAALAVAVLTAWMWLTVGGRSLDARVNTPPQIAGHWVGTSAVSGTLRPKLRIDLDITILPDGSFEGAVGRAVITRGGIKPHLKGPIGYLQSKLGEPAYAMVLDLSAPPIPAPPAARPSVTLCFDVRGEELVGAVHASNGREDLRDLHAVLHR